MGWFLKHKIDKKIIKEILDETIKHNGCDCPLNIEDQLGAINVKVNLDGHESAVKTIDYKKEADVLLGIGMFGQEIKEYIAEQFQELALENEKELAKIIRGKIYGASEFYARIKAYSLEYEDYLKGLGNKTIDVSGDGETIESDQ